MLQPNSASPPGHDRSAERQLPQPGQSRTLLTAEEVAAMVGMGVDWIYGESRRGRIPTVKLGR